MIIHAATTRNFFDALSDEDPVTTKIVSFSRLEPGWHFGDGRPPTPCVTALAIRIANLARLNGATSVEAFPDIDGGVLVSAYCRQDTAEILCRVDGRLEFVYERNDEEVDSATVHSWHDVARLLGALQWRDESSSDFYTQNISAGKRKDIQVSLSKTLLEVGFRSSMPPVSHLETSHYVTISPDITPESGRRRSASLLAFSVRYSSFRLQLGTANDSIRGRVPL